MTGLERTAATTAIYRTRRTWARPPQIQRLPCKLPLSRLNGASPARAAICLRLSAPSSGKCASRVLESTLPTPGTERSNSSRSRHRGVSRINSARSSSKPESRFSNQRMCSSTLRCKTFGALARRFFSAVSISTNWRRRVTSASSAWACSFANGRASGRTASPKRASTSASSRSVLASRPVARAKSRTCLGLTIATAIPLVARALATGVSRPPVASRITKSGGVSCLSNSRIPASSLATEKAAPADPMNTSSAALATSIPTNRLTSSMFHPPQRGLPRLAIRDFLPTQPFGLSAIGEVEYGGLRPSVTRRLTVAEATERSYRDDSCWCRRQVAHSDQVVGRQCQAEHPSDPRDPAMAGLTQPAYGLDPAKDLFHPFALALAKRVAGMVSGTLVDDTGLLARKMRGDPMLAHFLHQRFAVVAFVGTQRDPAPARKLLYHRQRRLWFGASARFGDAAVDCQPVTILHQHMAGVAEPGFLARTLARQQRFWVGRGLVGIVAALLAVKVHTRIARIVVLRPGLRPFAIFALETLLSGPCFNQRAVNREVLVGEQVALAGLRQHRCEEGPGHFAPQQPVAVFGEDRHVPHRVVDTQSHEPAEQEIVVELLHQQPFAAHRVQHLQQQRAQQPLRRNRRTPQRRIHAVEALVQILERRIRHRADRPQRMILGHAPLRRNVAEHPRLFVVRPAHPHYLTTANSHSLYISQVRNASFSASC